MLSMCFLYLLTICIPSFERGLLISFAHLLIGCFAFNFLVVYTFEIVIPFEMESRPRFFSCSGSCFFAQLIVSFALPKSFNFR